MVPRVLSSAFGVFTFEPDCKVWGQPQKPCQSHRGQQVRHFLPLLLLSEPSVLIFAISIFIWFHCCALFAFGSLIYICLLTGSAVAYNRVWHLNFDIFIGLASNFDISSSPTLSLRFSLSRSIFTTLLCLLIFTLNWFALEGRAPQTPRTVQDGSRSPKTRKGKGKGKDKGKDKAGKDGNSSGVEAPSFAPLAKELPAWPTLDSAATSQSSSQQVVNSAALARDQEAVKLLKQAYPDSSLMPQESKDFIDRVEKETAKTVTRSLHSTTTAMDRAHKTLTEATEAKKLHRPRWANHLSEAIKVWEGQLHDYRIQQSNFQEVITKARSDIETCRATIQGLTAKATPPTLAAAVPPLQLDIEDLTGDSEIEEERLQKQLQSVFRNSIESLGVSMTTVAELPEEAMDDDNGPETKKRPRSLEPFAGGKVPAPAMPNSQDVK
eukprot:s546_g13.t1